MRHFTSHSETGCGERHRLLFCPQREDPQGKRGLDAPQAGELPLQRAQSPPTSINLRPAPVLRFQDGAGENARRWQAGVWWRDWSQASLAKLAGEGLRSCRNSRSRSRGQEAEGRPMAIKQGPERSRTLCVCACVHVCVQCLFCFSPTSSPMTSRASRLLGAVARILGAPRATL